MFPNNGSVTRPLPSLLPGSGGTPSPVFYRYYEAAKTTVVAHRALRLFSVAPGGLELTSLVCSPGPGSPRPKRLGVVHRFSPAPVCGPKETYGAPRFPENPITPLPYSQIPAEPRRLASLRRSGVAPANSTTKAPARNILSRLNHMALAFTVYASCRPLGRRRKTRFRGWLTFSGWDWLPTEFFRAVSAAPPLLLGFSWREEFGHFESADVTLQPPFSRHFVAHFVGTDRVRVKCSITKNCKFAAKHIAFCR